MITNKNILRKRDGWKEELQSRESQSFLLFLPKKGSSKSWSVQFFFEKNMINPGKKILFQKIKIKNKKIKIEIKNKLKK